MPHINVDQANRYVDAFHALARGMLIGQMLDLLEEHTRVVQQADYTVEAASDAQKMSTKLRTVHVLDVDTVEQRSWLRVTFEQSINTSTYALSTSLPKVIWERATSRRAVRAVGGAALRGSMHSWICRCPSAAAAAVIAARAATVCCLRLSFGGIIVTGSLISH